MGGKQGRWGAGGGGRAAREAVSKIDRKKERKRREERERERERERKRKRKGVRGVQNFEADEYNFNSLRQREIMEGVD